MDPLRIYLPREQHADRGNSVDIVLLSASKPENIESFVHDLHFFSIVNRFDFNLSHGHERIVVNVVAELALLVEVHLVGYHEVKDVVGSLVGRLVGDTRFLQEVSLNISSSHLTHVVKPDTDKLSKPRGVVIPHSLGVTKGLHHGVSLDNLVL